LGDKFLRRVKYLEQESTYTFGEFRVSVEERTVYRNGERLSLTPKMFDLLLLLVRNAGRIVEKEELLSTIWPDSFVEEGSITYNIRQLRLVLGDEFQAPIYIETVPRRGYRFLAKVEKSAPLPAKAADEASEPDHESKRDAKRLRQILFALAAVLGFLFGAAVFIVWLLSERTVEASTVLSTPFKLEKLSTDGQVYQSAVSRDGKLLVYTRQTAGKQSLWRENLETHENTPIDQSPNVLYYGLALSPDARTVYVSRGPSSGPQHVDIFRESIFGGVPERIIGNTEGWNSISPDGETISFVRCPRGDQEYCSLWTADAIDGKNERKLTDRPRPIRIGDNEISPDGKSIAFAVGQSGNGANDFGLMRIDLATLAESQLTPEKFFNISHIAWLPGQKDLLITARKQSEKTFRIWKVSIDTGETSMLTSDAQSYSNLSLNENASLLISSQVESNFRLNIFRADAPGEAPKKLATASTVGYTPSGKLLFSSSKTGNEDIWSMNADGTDERQLTRNSFDDVSPIMSADGSLIFFASNRTGKLQIWKMNSDGSEQTQVTLDQGGSPLLVSRDNRWLYYRAAVHKIIKRVSVADGHDEVVFDKPTADGMLSPDGGRLAYSERTDNGNVLRIASLTDGTVVATYPYAEPDQNLVGLAWSHNSQFLAYILADEPENTHKLWFQPLDQPKPKMIADLHEEQIFELSGFALAPDDNSFALVRGSWNHDAVLIRGLK
jgi:Tol biopolymer transport system component/DNA-binding winged helix-turn-helix (wHTH) protein